LKRVVCWLLVLCMCSTAVGCSKDDTSDNDREEKTETSVEDTEEVDEAREMMDGDEVYVSTENFKVTNAMLSYYFNNQYYQTASKLEQMGVDITRTLKDSQYTADRSWFDFIMEDMTIPQVKQTLILCEAAKAAGFELSDHDREYIDEAVNSIEEMTEQYAKSQGGTKTYYIRVMYGYGVNMDDIRDAIELSQIASAYYESLMGSYDYTEADWNKYLEVNREDFLVEVDGDEPYLEEYLTKNCRVIAVTAGEGSSITDARDAIIKKFEDGGKTEEKFAELAKTHSADSSAHETGGLMENISKDDIQIEEIKEWIYADNRRVGDYTVISNGKQSTDEIIYIVYYLGDGMIKWQADVNEAMISEAYEEEYEKFERTYKVSVDLDGVYKIPSQAGVQ